MHSRKWFALAVGTFIAINAGVAAAEDIVVRVRPPHAVVAQESLFCGRLS